MTRRNGRRSRAPTALVTGLTAGALLLAGCASVPSSGPVTRADDLAVQEPEVRYEPPGPVAGSTPLEIVLGFLDAQQAYPASIDTAAQFLAPDAAAAWRPAVRTVVYDRVDTRRQVSTVELTTRRVATVSARGDYSTRVDAQPRRDHVFSLVQEEGEWRIENPPDATYVSATTFERYYRPYSLFFLDITREVLVAEPVWLPSGSGLPTLLLRGLLAGPSRALGKAVSTAVPGDADSVSTVTSDDGVVEVRLPASAASLSQRQRDLLSAQLVWTMQQAPGVEGVRVMLGEAPLGGDGVSAVQPVGSWQSFDPSDPASRGQLFALRRGRLVAVSEDGAFDFAGRFGESAQGIAAFDINLDLTTIAALSAADGRLLVSELADPAGDTGIATWYVGSDLLEPTWDRYGQLWVVDRDGGSSQVLVVSADGARAIDSGIVSRGRVLSYALSPDGSRFAAVVRGPSSPDARAPERRGGATQDSRREPREVVPAPRVVVGRIVRSEGRGAVRVDRVQPLVTAAGTLDRPVDLAWRSATELVVLARVDGSPPEPFTVRIDGSQVIGGLLTGATPVDDPQLVSVESSGDPADPVYVAGRGGSLLSQDDVGRWTPVSPDRLRFPTFPG